MSKELGLLLLIVAGWSLQIWMSSQQMRRFNARSHQLRKLGDFMAVGLAGGNYRRKIYSILVTTLDGRVAAAEELTGFTIFANTTPVPEVVGLDVFEIGEGEPPEGVSAKTWASLEHAAGFIEKKVTRERASSDADSSGANGGEMS